jgi:putative transposase
MTLANDRRGRHLVSAMHVHSVFMTRYRHEVLTGEMTEYLVTVFRAVCDDFESTMVECNGLVITYSC